MVSVRRERASFALFIREHPLKAKTLSCDIRPFPSTKSLFYDNANEG